MFPENFESYYLNQSPENPNTKIIEQFLIENPVDFFREIANLIEYYVENDQIEPNKLQFCTMTLKNSIRTIVDQNRIKEWKPKNEGEKEWRENVRKLLERLLEYSISEGNNTAIYAAEALSLLNEFQIKCNELVSDDEIFLLLMNEEKKQQLLNGGLYTYISYIFHGNYLSEKSPNYKLIINQAFDLFFIPKNELCPEAAAEKVKILYDLDERKLVKPIEDLLTKDESGQKFEMIIDNLWQYFNENESLCKLIYDFFDVIIDNYYSKVEIIMSKNYDTILGHIKSGNEFVQTLAFNFWRSVAAKEQKIPQRENMKYISRSLDDLLFIIKSKLDKLQPNPNQIIVESHESLQNTCLELLHTFFMLETERVFQFVHDNFNKSNKNVAHDYYSNILQYEAIITKVKSQEISNFFKSNLTKFDRSRNVTIYYTTLKCIAKTLAYYPELFQNQENVSTTIDLVLNNSSFEKMPELYAINLYILSLTLFYSKEEYLMYKSEDLLNVIKERLLSIDLETTSDEVGEMVFDCITSLSRHLKTQDLRELWQQIIDNVTKYHYLANKDILFKTIIGLSSRVKPNEDLLNRTVELLLDDPDEIEYACIASLQQYFSEETIERYGEKIFSDVIDSLKTHDSNTIESPSVVINIFANNYPDLFQKYSEEIIASMIECLKESSVLPTAVCSTILILYNIENYQESVIKKYNTEILDVALDCVHLSNNRETLEVYSAVFGIISIIIDKIEEPLERSKVSQIFKLIKELYEKKIYSDELALKVTKVINILNTKYPKMIGYHIMHKSVFWIVESASHSQNSELLELSSTILSLIN